MTLIVWLYGLTIVFCGSGAFCWCHIAVIKYKLSKEIGVNVWDVYAFLSVGNAVVTIMAFWEAIHS